MIWADATLSHGINVDGHATSCPIAWRFVPRRWRDCRVAYLLADDKFHRPAHRQQTTCRPTFSSYFMRRGGHDYRRRAPAAGSLIVTVLKRRIFSTDNRYGEASAHLLIASSSSSFTARVLADISAFSRKFSGIEDACRSREDTRLHLSRFSR